MMAKKNINQKQGPRTGNAGRASKVAAFRDSKSDRGSYLQQMADMVSNAFTSRGQAMRPNQPQSADPAALKGISTDTRTRRGPR